MAVLYRVVMHGPAESPLAADNHDQTLALRRTSIKRLRRLTPEDVGALGVVAELRGG